MYILALNIAVLTCYRVSCRSVISVLLPIFASYKALRSSNPAELAPWLMYWVVLSGILLVESWTLFIIGWYVSYKTLLYAGALQRI
jgi:hypothetical protein